MTIPQIANNPNVDNHGLANHAHVIRGTLNFMSTETDRAMEATLVASNIGFCLLSTLNTCRDEGVNVEAASALLNQSHRTLFDASRKLGLYAQAYTTQLRSHDLVMTAPLGGTPLRPRVVTCEKEAIRLMNRQLDYLQRNVGAIYEAERGVREFQNLFGGVPVSQNVLPAVRRLMWGLQ